jgi:hypothetical protein
MIDAAVSLAMPATMSSSALRTAMPPLAAWGRAWTSSALARPMAWRVPNSPRCADPTFSTMPTCGGVSVVR